MLWVIARKEILDNFAGPKFVVTFLLGTVLMLLALYTGLGEYRADVKEYNAAVALDRRNLESQNDLMYFMETGTRINRMPEILGIMVRGIQNVKGRQARINTTSDPELTESKYSTTPLLFVFEEIDLLFIVKIILSLFAILFTYNAIVGEKEQGTLKLAIANSISRHHLILGKTTGGFISLMAPLTVPFVLYALVLAVSHGIHLSGEDWVRMGLLFLLFSLYISVFFMLGILVSTMTGRSSHSLFFLLFSWCCFIFIIPSAITIVAKRIHPVPSAHEITSRKDSIERDNYKSIPTIRKQWEIKNPSENTPEYWAKYTAFLENLQKEFSKKLDQRYDELERDYQQQKNAQLLASMNAARISPAAALAYGSMSLGRTGINEYFRYESSARRYKQAFTQWIIPKNMRTPDNGKVHDLSDMPKFHFEPEKLDISLLRAIPDFSVLFGEILLLLLGAVFAFRKYDVR